jgi:colanic acid biosynthesis protein WcaH
MVSTTPSPLTSPPPDPRPASSAPKLSPSRFLNHDDLGTVIRLAPLIAIDFVIRNARDEVLLGLRNNEPAKDRYFVPGGMVLKDERLADAFSRLLKTETNYTLRIDDARLLGAFEHFYKNNRFGNSDYGTHYVVLGYELGVPDAAEPRPDDQHSELRWWPLTELLASDRVHDNTKAYFAR